jgi:hypothetical protein
MLTESDAASPARTEEAEWPKSRQSAMLEWVAFALFGMAAARLAFRVTAPITDPDTWWHLRLGEEFRGSWSLADPGSLSPFATRPWFATQWTLEVVASYLEEALGLAAVSWLTGVGVIALAVAVYVACRERGSILAAAVASSVALVATTESLAPRPQVASFIFAAVVTTAWLRTMDDLKPRWWLVPLSWLWACTHGMWFVGVLVGVMVVLGLFLDGRLNRRNVIRVGLVPLGALVAAAVTPVGPKLIVAPLHTSQMARFVDEWAPPNFLEVVPALAALMVAVVLATWARCSSRRSWAEILLLAMAVGWILLYYRTIAVGAVVAAPLLAGAIESWLPASRMRVSTRWETWLGIAFALLTVVGVGVAASAQGPPPLEQMESTNKALGDLPSGTIVFNEYALGGWIEWKHRNIAPVVDGMVDAYEVGHVVSYGKIVRLDPGWRDLLDRTNARYALLPYEGRLAAALLEGKEWNVMVRERGYVLLRRIPER